MQQNDLSASVSATWQAPVALTHHTWQAAWASCHVAFSESKNAFKAENAPSLCVDWQDCLHVDSSAIAFILALKRDFAEGANLTQRVQHQNPPLQLRQLAALYELDDMLGLAA